MDGNRVTQALRAGSPFCGGNVGRRIGIEMDEITNYLMLCAFCLALFIFFCGGLLLSGYRQTIKRGTAPRKKLGVKQGTAVKQRSTSV
jgi:hypothetical protein